MVIFLISNHTVFLVQFGIRCEVSGLLSTNRSEEIFSFIYRMEEKISSMELIKLNKINITFVVFAINIIAYVFCQKHETHSENSCFVCTDKMIDN